MNSRSVMLTPLTMTTLRSAFASMSEERRVRAQLAGRNDEQLTALLSSEVAPVAVRALAARLLRERTVTSVDFHAGEQ